MTKTATVSLHGNTYEVDAALVGSRVEVVFDPFDLEAVEVRFQGRPMGQGVPVVIGRHTHPQARPEAAPAPAPTGIDYLGLLARAPRRRAGPITSTTPSSRSKAPEPYHRRGQRQPTRQGDPAMTIDRLRAHWGFSRMPFSKDLAPSMLHAHARHAEAVARVSGASTSGPSGCHRRSGLRQDRGCPGRAGRARRQPPHRHLPRQPVGGHAGPVLDDRVQPRRDAPVPPGLAHPPGRTRPSPPRRTSGDGGSWWSWTRRTCSTPSSSRVCGC